MAEIETYPDETLEERIKTWEKEKKGILGDLQAERAQRQALEERLNTLESSIPVPEDGTPEQKVTRFTQDPDGYVSEVVSQAVEPLVKEIGSLKFERKIERAYGWLSKQEKKDVDEIYGSDIEKEIVRITKERGMQSMDPIEGTKAAYKIYLQEKKEREEREAQRDQNISGQSTESVRSVVSRTSGGRLTREDISHMSPEEFNKRYDEIKEAERKGLIK